MMEKIPTWIIIGALLASGAGAAVGTVLSGSIVGKAPVTVSQALLLSGKPSISGSYDREFTSISDDNAGFTAAVELNNGDKFTIDLPWKNHSAENVVAELKLSIPDPLQVDASWVRTGEETWKNEISGGDSGTLSITVAVPDNAKPGFYQIEGRLKVVNF